MVFTLTNFNRRYFCVDFLQTTFRALPAHSRLPAFLSCSLNYLSRSKVSCFCKDFNEESHGFYRHVSAQLTPFSSFFVLISLRTYLWVLALLPFAPDYYVSLFSTATACCVVKRRLTCHKHRFAESASCLGGYWSQNKSLQRIAKKYCTTKSCLIIVNHKGFLSHIRIFGRNFLSL